MAEHLIYSLLFPNSTFLKSIVHSAVARILDWSICREAPVSLLSHAYSLYTASHKDGMWVYMLSAKSRSA
jgi:hypothetical protein